MLALLLFLDEGPDRGKGTYNASLRARPLVPIKGFLEDLGRRSSILKLTENTGKFYYVAFLDFFQIF